MIRVKPDRIRLLLTYACNTTCFYCHNEGQSVPERRLVDHIFVRNLLDMIDIHKVVISGGEPTLHPEIVEIAREIGNRTDVKLKINTNGSKPDVIDHISDYLHAININIDSVDAESYGKIKRGLTLELAVESLRLARTKGVETIVNSPLTSIEDALKLLEFGEETGTKIKFLELLMPDFAKPNIALWELKRKLVSRGYRVGKKGEWIEELKKDGYPTSLIKCFCRVAVLQDDEEKAMNFCRDNTGLVISPAGRLKPCAYDDSTAIDIYPAVMRRDETELSIKLDEFHETYGIGSCQEIIRNRGKEDTPAQPVVLRRRNKP